MPFNLLRVSINSRCFPMTTTTKQQWYLQMYLFEMAKVNFIQIQSKSKCDQAIIEDEMHVEAFCLYQYVLCFDIECYAQRINITFYIALLKKFLWQFIFFEKKKLSKCIMGKNGNEISSSTVSTNSQNNHIVYLFGAVVLEKLFKIYLIVSLVFINGSICTYLFVNLFFVIFLGV